jgi:hypothetical protein
MREVTGFRDVVMLEIKLILCPVDFSEFPIRAYHYALSLAELPLRETIRSSAGPFARVARRDCRNS